MEGSEAANRTLTQLNCKKVILQRYSSEETVDKSFSTIVEDINYALKTFDIRKTQEISLISHVEIYMAQFKKFLTNILENKSILEQPSVQSTLLFLLLENPKLASEFSPFLTFDPKSMKISSEYPLEEVYVLTFQFISCKINIDKLINMYADFNSSLSYVLRYQKIIQNMLDISIKIAKICKGMDPTKRFFFYLCNTIEKKLQCFGSSCFLIQKLVLENCRKDEFICTVDALYESLVLNEKLKVTLGEIEKNSKFFSEHFKKMKSYLLKLVMDLAQLSKKSIFNQSGEKVQLISKCLAEFCFDISTHNIDATDATEVILQELDLNDYLINICISHVIENSNIERLKIIEFWLKHFLAINQKIPEKIKAETTWDDPDADLYCQTIDYRKSNNKNSNSQSINSVDSTPSILKQMTDLYSLLIFGIEIQDPLLITEHLKKASVHVLTLIQDHPVAENFFKMLYGDLYTEKVISEIRSILTSSIDSVQEK